MDQNGKPKDKQNDVSNGGGQGLAWVSLAQLIVVCGTLIAVVYILWG